MLNIGIVILTLAVLYMTFFVVPPIKGLGYLSRIIFFHIPMAWVSVIAFVMSAWWSVKYIKKRELRFDRLAARSAAVGFFFVILATVSGAIFSKLTWGAYWNWDPRQTTIFALILLYGAYLTLRAAIESEESRAKISAVYACFSCIAVPFLMFIIPRLYFSLHPSPIINGKGSIDMEFTALVTLILAVTDATLIYMRLLYSQRKNCHNC
ncbi:MAG: cytochrome c biogenesis protein CcsA [Selenomonadaceae bacterium]|nr:cytochrome c biogenesis protein CcsA [Selenomonadaceae bacterium]